MLCCSPLTPEAHTNHKTSRERRKIQPNTMRSPKESAGIIIGIAFGVNFVFEVLIALCLYIWDQCTCPSDSPTNEGPRPTIVQIQTPRGCEEAIVHTQQQQPPPAYSSLSSQTCISSSSSYRLQSDNLQLLPPYSENSHSIVVMQPRSSSLPVPLYQGQIAPEAAYPYPPGIVPIQRERSDMSASVAPCLSSTLGLTADLPYLIFVFSSLSRRCE